ncbi:MAG: carbamoyltransferase HypF [Actinomycetota bacterium]|nr:carbamoyltransferase HypF [Actinomycetota bacterium]
MRGTVQGVGFRPFVYRVAIELGLAGQVSNDSEGVLVEVEGPVEALATFGRRLLDEAPPLARIHEIDAQAVPPIGDATFRIVQSRAGAAPASAVSVDVATCEDCLAELSDPADRRFGYPFTNCTNCGPRYTIIRSIPYDRPATTMAGFPMCDACAAEYHNPADRRFHAQPNACPACGPHLALLAPDGTTRAERGEALEGAARCLLARGVLAVKGLGGYHLAVLADDDGAVGELRRRKHRDDKPFAVMVADLAAARALCALSPEAEAALASPRRPIVLAPRRQPNPSPTPTPDVLAAAAVDNPTTSAARRAGADVAPVPAELADGVAPGLPELGLMLPYTPLHHLLLARVGRPLVMTSGNASDEPIAHDDHDAVARLGPMVDALLVHDRPIHIRCDDSVVRSRAGGGVQMVRRSRGYAPEPLALPEPARRQVLAVGAELKSTVAVAKDGAVVASHHLGDLEHLAAYRSFLQAVDHLCHLAGVEPEVVAHDLHPEYLSTTYALETELPTLGVQHHHAHVASCLVEHGDTGPVLGLAFDGLGLGACGRLWGGELLVADLRGFRRVGHLRPVPLPGGDRANREPWRMAMAWTEAALGRAAAARYGREVDGRWEAVLGLIEHPGTATTTSVGRLFDAVAALVGLHPRMTYEGQAPIALEAATAGVPLGDGAGYEAAIDSDGEAVVLDPAPLVARVVAERERGTPVAVIAAGFHDGLGRSAARLAVELARRHGLDTVALSGGVFQNARLSALVEQACRDAGLRVLVHHDLPPNDGGISVGQAAVAALAPATAVGPRP